MTDRERLHVLVDALPDAEVPAALRFVEQLAKSLPRLTSLWPRTKTPSTGGSSPTKGCTAASSARIESVNG